jgi:hypothetical protein
MFKQSPTLYRWYFAVWETPGLIAQQDPEVQNGITSAKFTPKGRFQASKAYTWTCQLLQRQFQGGAGVEWDDHFPLACRIKVGRDAGKDYIKIEDVEAWPEGAAALATLREQLQQLRADIEASAPLRLEVVPTSASDGAAAPPRW